MSRSNAIYLEPPGGFDRLMQGEADVRAPGPGEISVRLRASSLNYHDYSVVRGLRALQARRIPMSDGAGEVTAVGDAVDAFSVGDHVVSAFFPTWSDGEPSQSDFANVPGDGIDGFARESVTLPVNYFTHAPHGYSHAEAATLTTAGLTAWRALFVDGALKPGETVLVLGSGGVSVFAMQFAKAAGATVIATSSSDARLARLRELGADHLINYREDENWGDTARCLSGGVGVDHVIEIGGASTLDQSMAAARVGGHIAVIGVLGQPRGAITVTQLLRKHLRLTGLLVGSRRHQLDMVRALNVSRMRPVIDRHFALGEIADAFRYQERAQHIGKIVLDI